MLLSVKGSGRLSNTAREANQSDGRRKRFLLPNPAYSTHPPEYSLTRSFLRAHPPPLGRAHGVRAWRRARPSPGRKARRKPRSFFLVGDDNNNNYPVPLSEFILVDLFLLKHSKLSDSFSDLYVSFPVSLYIKLISGIKFLAWISLLTV